MTKPTQEHSKNAVLVSLNFSVWEANARDRRGSEEAARLNEVTDGKLCRLRKSLLPRNEPMAAVNAAVRAARMFHYRNTHTWLYSGPRILTRQNFDTYMQKMRLYEAQVQASVENLLAAYPDLCQQAAQALGKLYDPRDYPTVDELRKEYSFSLTVLPLPMAANLVDLGLGDAETEELREKLESNMAATFNAATEQLWTELQERVSKLAAKLSDPKAYVMPETVAGVADLSELIPRVNLTGDETLNTVAKGLCESLAGATAESIKHDPSRREKLAMDMSAAHRLLERLKAERTSNANGKAPASSVSRSM